MGKSVLYGQVTFGRNHSYPSTSIAKKVAKMEKFPPVHEHQLHLKTVLFFFGTTTFLNVNCLGELTLKVYYMAKKLFKHVEISWLTSSTCHMNLTSRPPKYYRHFVLNCEKEGKKLSPQSKLLRKYLISVYGPST